MGTNILDYVIIGIILLLLVLAIVFMFVRKRKMKKKGLVGCSGGCYSCQEKCEEREDDFR